MLHAQGELQDIQYARKRVGSTNRAAMFLVNPGTYVATHDRETVPEEVLVLRHDGLYVGGVVNQTIEIVTDADPDTHHHYPVTPLGLGGETPLSPSCTCPPPSRTRSAASRPS